MSEEAAATVAAAAAPTDTGNGGDHVPSPAAAVVVVTCENTMVNVTANGHPPMNVDGNEKAVPGAVAPAEEGREGAAPSEAGEEEKREGEDTRKIRFTLTMFDCSWCMLSHFLCTYWRHCESSKYFACTLLEMYTLCPISLRC